MGVAADRDLAHLDESVGLAHCPRTPRVQTVVDARDRGRRGGGGGAAPDDEVHHCRDKCPDTALRLHPANSCCARPAGRLRGGAQLSAAEVAALFALRGVLGVALHVGHPHSLNVLVSKQLQLLFTLAYQVLDTLEVAALDSVRLPSKPRAENLHALRALRTLGPTPQRRTWYRNSLRTKAVKP